MESLNELPVIEAGSNLPRVHIDNLGFMLYDRTVNPTV